MRVLFPFEKMCKKDVYLKICCSRRPGYGQVFIEVKRTGHRWLDEIDVGGKQQAVSQSCVGSGP